jgi:hypothetical protein
VEQQDEILADLAKLGETRTWEPGTAVVSEGEVADCMYIIHSGELRAMVNRLLQDLACGGYVDVSPEQHRATEEAAAKVVSASPWPAPARHLLANAFSICATRVAPVGVTLLS